MSLAVRAEPEVALRPVTGAHDAELRSFLRDDVWNGVYLLGMLHAYGIEGPRSRFIGAFVGDRLVGVLGEAREVHCWYASIAGRDAAVAGALARGLRLPAVEVVLGPEDLVDALLRALPSPARRTTRMALCVSHDGMSLPRPKHAVRRAVPSDLLGLVDLYEGYEFDGYPTRRHLRRALTEHIAQGGVYLIELDGRPVAARRIEASSPDVVLFGGLTVDPAYRGRDLGRDVRLGSSIDLLERGVPHCSLRDGANPHLAGHELREHSPWLVANLTPPKPAAWAALVRRARARFSPWDRPCRRRRLSYAPSVRV